MNMLTRRAMKFANGEFINSVINQPLIADKIITILLHDNDWTSVINLLYVFRIGDCVGDKLNACKRINDTNKTIYNRLMFDTKITFFIRRIRSLSNFKKRISIHNEMFEYMISNYDLFETSSVYDHIFEVLFHYLRFEPFYERQALRYIKILYPDIFYKTDLIEVYDNHELDLFDGDYGPQVIP